MNKKSGFKKLECLFAWSELYSNGKNLALPTIPNQEAFNKTKTQIMNLKNELID